MSTIAWTVLDPAAETRKAKRESEAANFEADVMPWRAQA
jgi:hypothetical protein